MLWGEFEEGRVLYTCDSNVYWWRLDAVIKNKLPYIGRVVRTPHGCAYTITAAPAAEKEEAGQQEVDLSLG